MFSIKKFAYRSNKCSIEVQYLVKKLAYSVLIMCIKDLNNIVAAVKCKLPFYKLFRKSLTKVRGSVHRVRMSARRV